MNYKKYFLAFGIMTVLTLISEYDDFWGVMLFVVFPLSFLFLEKKKQF